MTHMKRLAAPRSWSIKRKTNTWAVAPSPGPHPKELCLTLKSVVRDILHYANTGAEAIKIISSGDVLVDGKKVRDYRYPVGLMDVISIPKTKDYFRVLLDERGTLRFVTISEEDAKFKFARVENKIIIKKGAVQLNLSGGRNLLLKKDEGAKYNTGDVLKLDMPSQKIIDYYEFKEGATALVTRGKHTGEIVAIKAVEIIRSSEPDVVTLKGAGGAEFSTRKENVFIVGKDKAEIKLPEVSVI